MSVVSPAGTSIAGATDQFGYTVYTPHVSRFLDSRIALGTPHAIGRNELVTVAVPGLLPSTRAVVINLTATGLTRAPSTYISACPGGTPQTDCTRTSVLNPQLGGNVATQLTLPLGPDNTIEFVNYNGSIDLVADLAGELSDGYNGAIPTGVGQSRNVTLYNNSGSVDLIVDYHGYFATGYTSTTVERIFDTRTGTGTAKSPLPAGSTTTFDVPDVPSNAVGIELGVTALGLTQAPADYLTLCAVAAGCGIGPDKTSSINPAANSTAANQVTVPIGPDRQLSVYNFRGNITFVIDLRGFYVVSTAPTTTLRANRKAR